VKIYISHPYGRRRGLDGETLLENVYASIKIARQVVKRGHNPFVPNLYHFIHDGWEDSPSEDVWFEMVSAWVSDCDALYYGGDSEGCRIERQIAESYGLKIFNTVKEIPMSEKFDEFVEERGGWWCPKCQKRVEIATFYIGRGDALCKEVSCLNCGLTLHKDYDKRYFII